MFDFLQSLFKLNHHANKKLETVQRAESQLMAVEEAWKPIIVRIEEEASRSPSLSRALREAKRDHDRATE